MSLKSGPVGRDDCRSSCEAIRSRDIGLFKSGSADSGAGSCLWKRAMVKEGVHGWTFRLVDSLLVKDIGVVLCFIVQTSKLSTQ